MNIYVDDELLVAKAREINYDYSQAKIQVVDSDVSVEGYISLVFNTEELVDEFKGLVFSGIE